MHKQMPIIQDGPNRLDMPNWVKDGTNKQREQAYRSYEKYPHILKLIVKETNNG